MVITKVAESITKSVLEKGMETSQGVGKANVSDGEKFMNLMQESQQKPPAQGVESIQLKGTTSIAPQGDKSVGDHILEGIANTAKTQQVGYQSAMGQVMSATKNGAHPADILKAQVQLAKIEIMQQAEGKAASKVDQTIENLLKGG